MKTHPDNPSSNTIGAGVSEESLKQAISDSGYPLQAVAADQLKKTFEASKIYSYLIQEEWPFIDGDTGTVRSLDIHARVGFEPRRDTHIRPTIDLLIECKQIELPTVFFVRPRILGPALEYPRLAGNPHDRISVVSSPDSDRYLLTIGRILGFESHEFNTLPIRAISMARVHRKGNKLELSGDDTYPNIVRPLAKATDHFVDTCKPDPSRQCYFDLHMLASVAVIRGPMIGVSSSEDGDDELTYVPWVRLHRLEPSNSDILKQWGEVRAMDVVHASYLDTYAKHLLSFGELMSQRVEKIAVPIIWGQGRVPKAQADNFMSEEIFRILRPTVTRQTFQREMEERVIRAHSG